MSPSDLQRKEQLQRIGGTWEAEFPDKTDAAGTLQSKGKVTFSDNSYTYSWYKNLVGPDNAVVYDWTETARETGSASFAPDYMEWTADSFGEAEFNDGTKTWGDVAMKSSKNEYAIQYTVEGDTLTLKEDIVCHPYCGHSNWAGSSNQALSARSPLIPNLSSPSIWGGHLRAVGGRREAPSSEKPRVL